MEEKNTCDKLIDLHTHTIFSDGELSPNALVRLAVKKNVGVLAITDHDTLEGVKNLNRNDKIIVDSGIRVINGIELSAKVSHGRMHILGYGIDLNSEKLNQKLIELKDNSINSVLSLMEQIKRDYYIIFGYEDIKEMVNANHNLNRVDLAKLCVKYGYATGVQDAFHKYLIPAYEKTGNIRRGLSYAECINLIHASHGISVLAHPKSLELEKKEFLVLLKDMITSGLDGIEVYHSSHSKEEMDFYKKVAKEYNLLVSGGSDYHGASVKPDIEIAKGKENNLNIKKLSVLKKFNR